MKDDINDDSEDSYQYPYWCNNYILEEHLKDEYGNLELNNIKSLISEILNSTYNHDYLYSTFSSNFLSHLKLTISIGQLTVLSHSTSKFASSKCLKTIFPISGTCSPAAL